MLTETHGQRTIMTMGEESIVKNTVLEGHAHGDTPARSHTEPDGGLDDRFSRRLVDIDRILQAR